MSKPVAVAHYAVTDEADTCVARASAHGVLADTPEFRRAERRNPALRPVAERILADLTPDDVAALARVLLASVPGAVPRGAASYGRPVEAEMKAKELALVALRIAAKHGSRSQKARDHGRLALQAIAALLPPGLGSDAPVKSRAKALWDRALREPKGAKR